MIACDQAEQISAELADLREEWNEDLQHWASHRNASRSQQKDSAALRILEDLPGTLVLTITTASRIHGISRTAASRGLETLRAAGILTTESVGGGRRAYTARSVLDAIIWAERHLASTHFDTRVSPPTRPVPEPVPAPGIPEKSRLCSTQLQKASFRAKTSVECCTTGPPSTKHGFRDTAHSYHPFGPAHPCRCSRFVHHRKHRQPASRTSPPSSEN